jgi:hypothetical protein
MVLDSTSITSPEKQVAFYNNLKSRKFPWTPIKPIASEYTKGAEDLFGRCLSLRVLEIPVGEFVTEASKKEFNVPSESLDLFLSNIADEDVHDKQLNLAAEVYPFCTPDHEKEAKEILQQWLDLDDHPLLKAMVLERSIFFIILPMLRMFGDTALRTISQDISRKLIAA